jgi:hexosaminidase
MKRGPGFRLHSGTKLVVADPSSGAQEAAQFLLETINPYLETPLKTAGQDSKSPSVIRFLPLARKPLKAEAYELAINAQHVDIKAADAAGFHYAVQSLRQLLPSSFYQTKAAPAASAIIPALHIYDYPRYAWRGLHLDVARNFHPVADVKRLLDLMAMHKLNQFHWHLTDDEGWRIEIKAFPQLTEIGAFRGYDWPLAPSLGSGPEKKGGFYTQDEIREVVAYAQKRQITILPEIDMPGHARAMIRSLPQLVDPSDQSVYESVQMYKDNVLSPCIPATYEVVDRILQEVASLFPGPYLHVGGDEVPDGVWNPERAPQCKALMAREGLQNKQQIENYFFKRIKIFVEKYGKTMAGWEEIAAKPGFADHKVLTFAWKSGQDGERLAKEGYPVVLNPADHLYFDLAYSEDPNEPGYYWAGTIDTAKVYSYAASASPNVRGIQGNLWSETIWTREDLDYRAFPRVVALAEIAWTPRARQNWQNFSQRLDQSHLPRLQAYGVQYRVAPGLSKLSSQP